MAAGPVERYQAALPWLSEAATMVDTTALPPQEVVERIAGGL